jgi:hypothetical protein
MAHLLDNNRIKDSQHGFMERFYGKKLCTKNLPDFPDKVTSTVDSDVNMNVVLLDFAKSLCREKC